MELDSPPAPAQPPAPAPPPPPPPPPDPHRNWAELPWDIIALILQKLGAVEVLTSAQYTCSSWRTLAKDPCMWKSIDLHPEGEFWDTNYDPEALGRAVIDRSSGGLISFRIEFYLSDALLIYIANRSSQLKQLSLLSSYSISEPVFCEAVKKFPLLEELEISYCSLSTQALEGAGSSCPLLTSLKLNCQGYKRPHIECDKEALAIAQNMPNLRYLQIFGNKLTNEGLKAILDGCPRLEFLDLRQCFNVNLDGDLGKRCAKQIKEVRGPYNSTDDYPFNPELPEYYSSEEDYPDGFSDIDMVTNDDDIFDEFSGWS